MGNDGEALRRPSHRRSHSSTSLAARRRRKLSIGAQDSQTTAGKREMAEDSHSVVDALDLCLPWVHRLRNAQAALEGSLAHVLFGLEMEHQRLRKRRAMQRERIILPHALHTGLEESITDSETDLDEYAGWSAAGYSTATDDEADEADERRSKTLDGESLPHGSLDRSDEADTLGSFADELRSCLSGVMEDIRWRMPSNPAPTLDDCLSLLDSLSNQYQTAIQLLQKLKASSYSIPHPDVSAGLATLNTFRLSIMEAAAFTQSSSSDTDTHTHSPSLHSVRTFFEIESDRLTQRLSSPLPALDRLASNISSAIHDASHFVHDEGEKIVDFVVDEAERFKEALRMGAERLLTYSELPPAWQNNKYITGSYRFIPANRPGKLLLSTLTWHNETVNIHTHLIPSLLIIWYIIFVFPSTPLGNPIDNSALDRSICLLFLLAALSCLLLSALWHTASGCATWSIFHGCATLDYNGVVALISCSILTITHQGFRCNPVYNIGYNVMTLLFCGVGMYLPWQAWFDKREYKVFRIFFFVCLAGGGIAPMLHLGISYGWAQTWDFFNPILYSIAAYSIGLMLYAFDFPERLSPSFNTLLHSHQFWHVSIVAAIALHWWALQSMSEKGLQGMSCGVEHGSLDWTSRVLRRLEL